MFASSIYADDERWGGGGGEAQFWFPLIGLFAGRGSRRSASSSSTTSAAKAGSSSSTSSRSTLGHKKHMYGEALDLETRLDIINRLDFSGVDFSQVRKAAKRLGI